MNSFLLTSNCAQFEKHNPPLSKNHKGVPIKSTFKSLTESPLTHSFTAATSAQSAAYRGNRKRMDYPS